MRSPEDHRAKSGTDPRKWTKPRVPTVKTAYDPSGWSTAQCSCGWDSGFCKRDKVREDRVDRHFQKRHGGTGIRL